MFSFQKQNARAKCISVRTRPDTTLLARRRQPRVMEKMRTYLQILQRQQVATLDRLRERLDALTVLVRVDAEDLELRQPATASRREQRLQTLVADLIVPEEQVLELRQRALLEFRRSVTPASPIELPPRLSSSSSRKAPPAKAKRGPARRRR